MKDHKTLINEISNELKYFWDKEQKEGPTFGSMIVLRSITTKLKNNSLYPPK
jgi:hypothetical protein